MRIAVIFDNFGPYHLARLSAASQAAEVLGVESGGKSHEYVWERSQTPSSFQTATLFPESSSSQVSTQDFRQKLSKVLNDFHPVAVAIPGWSGRGAFLAMEWCLQNRVPAIVMSESTAHDEVRNNWREWIKKRYVALCSAALVGGTLHADYMAQLGMKREQIFLGYDAVDNAYFANKVTKTSGKYSLPENYFLASARFIEKKNLSRLIEAYALYRKRAADSPIWSLVLLGDGPLRAALESQISVLGLEEFIRMPGFVQYPDLPAYYGLAGAFIHASTTEQWGLVVNEAMASGLPVLVSNRCGCAPDLVEEGVNGFTFDPANAKQLAELMLKLSTPGPQLSTMPAASQRIISQYGPERFAAGLLAAAEKTTTLPQPKTGLLDQLLIYLLLRK